MSSSVAKLEALLSRIQANRTQPRLVPVNTALIALPQAPSLVEVEEEDDEPVITTDEIDASSDPDVLQVVTEEFEEALTGETGVVPLTPIPAARTTPPSSPPAFSMPPPVSFRPGSPSPVTTGSQAGLLPSAPPKAPSSHPPAELRAERISSPSIQPPSSPIARAISEAPLRAMPATFGKLISRALSLRPR
jgi:hypothetical protein